VFRDLAIRSSVSESQITHRHSPIEGIVRAQLPSGLYEVDVEGHRITAHIGGGRERNFVRVLVGDRVIVELAPRDLNRGRIVRKA
jgi:translation initiation factor IF-1